jgi:hypothetical protein
VDHIRENAGAVGAQRRRHHVCFIVSNRTLGRLGLESKRLPS